MEGFHWLIERQANPAYLGTWEKMREFRWSADVNAALAFATKQQAEGAMMAIRQLVPALFHYDIAVSAVEHGWSAPSATPTDDVPIAQEAYDLGFKDGADAAKTRDDLATARALLKRGRRVAFRYYDAPPWEDGERDLTADATAFIADADAFLRPSAAAAPEKGTPAVPPPSVTTRHCDCPEGFCRDTMAPDCRLASKARKRAAATPGREP